MSNSNGLDELEYREEQIHNNRIHMLYNELVFSLKDQEKYFLSQLQIPNKLPLQSLEHLLSDVLETESNTVYKNTEVYQKTHLFPLTYNPIKEKYIDHLLSILGDGLSKKEIYKNISDFLYFLKNKELGLYGNLIDTKKSDKQNFLIIEKEGEVKTEELLKIKNLLSKINIKTDNHTKDILQVFTESLFPSKNQVSPVVWQELQYIQKKLNNILEDDSSDLIKDFFSGVVQKKLVSFEDRMLFTKKILRKKNISDSFDDDVVDCLQRLEKIVLLRR